MDRKLFSILCLAITSLVLSLSLSSAYSQVAIAKKGIAALARATGIPVIGEMTIQPVVDVAANKQLTLKMKMDRLRDKVDANKAYLQKTQMAKLITSGIETYQATTEIVGWGRSTFEIGRNAVDFAKQVAGDFKNVSDLKSYELMYTRLRDQEVNRLWAMREPRINFMRAYNSSIAKYLSPEGGVDFVGLAKSYANNQSIGYSKILMEMTNSRSAIYAADCQGYLVEATASENMSNAYRQEAAILTRFIQMKSIGEADLDLANAGATLDKIYGFGRDKDKITGRPEQAYNPKGLGSFLSTINDPINKAQQAMISGELKRHTEKNDLTYSNEKDINKRISELHYSAELYTEKARTYRDLAYGNCGEMELEHLSKYGALLQVMGESTAGELLDWSSR